MIVKIRDPATLAGIRPHLVAAYLRLSGWTRMAYEPRRYSIWVPRSGSGGAELLLPLDTRFADFAERMGQLLDDLQQFEQRSQLAILSDIETASCDVYRFRGRPISSLTGTIPIDAGADLVASARDLLLYGATAEYSPERRSLSGPRSGEVAAFMEAALLGQTEASSFVVRAQVPVPGKQIDDLFLDSIDPASEPFERRAGVKLMTLLAETREAAAEALETSDYRPFADLLNVGATVGLYTTVVDTQDLTRLSPLEIACSWAPGRPVVGEAPAKVVFEPELALPIREAVRILKPTQPTEVQLLGAVELLKQDAQEELIGELAVNTLVDSKVRRVHFFLERPQYDVAIEAFRDRQPIAVKGELVKEGKHWRLKNPTGVQIIRSPEPDDGEDGGGVQAEGGAETEANAIEGDAVEEEATDEE